MVANLSDNNAISTSFVVERGRMLDGQAVEWRVTSIRYSDVVVAAAAGDDVVHRIIVCVNIWRVINHHGRYIGINRTTRQIIIVP